jgi:hypothetical protein
VRAMVGARSGAKPGVWAGFAGCLLAGLLFGAPVAGAQTGAVSTAPDAYDQWVSEAIAEYEAGRWAEARTLFERAHAVKPNARTLRGLGVTAFEMRHYREAIDALQQAIADPRNPLTEPMRVAAEQTIERARQFVGTLRVALSPTNATLRVNGAVAQGHELQLDMGDYELSAEAPGYRATTVRVSVAGGKVRELTLTLTSATARAGAGPAAATAADRPRDDDSLLGKWWFWTAAGVVVAGGVLGAIVLSSSDDPQPLEKGRHRRRLRARGRATMKTRPVPLWLGLRPVLVLVLVLVLVGCDDSAVDQTQVVVLVDGQPGVRKAARALRVRIDSVEAGGNHLDERVTPKWPLELTLRPFGGDAERHYRVSVEALGKADALVALARLQSGFVAGERRFVVLMLEDDCIGVACEDASDTCHAARCVSARVDAAELGTRRDRAPELSDLLEPAARRDAATDAGDDPRVDGGGRGAPNDGAVDGGGGDAATPDSGAGSGGSGGSGGTSPEDAGGSGGSGGSIGTGGECAAAVWDEVSWDEACLQ